MGCFATGPSQRPPQPPPSLAHTCSEPEARCCRSSASATSSMAQALAASPCFRTRSWASVGVGVGGGGGGGVARPNSVRRPAQNALEGKHGSLQRTPPSQDGAAASSRAGRLQHARTCATVRCARAVESATSRARGSRRCVASHSSPATTTVCASPASSSSASTPAGSLGRRPSQDLEACKLTTGSTPSRAAQRSVHIPLPAGTPRAITWPGRNPCQSQESTHPPGTNSSGTSSVISPVRSASSYARRPWVASGRAQHEMRGGAREG